MSNTNDTSEREELEQMVADMSSRELRREREHLRANAEEFLSTPESSMYYDIIMRSAIERIGF